MKTATRCQAWALGCVVGAALALPAHGADHEYQNLVVEGGIATQPTSINEAGLIVGGYQQPQGRNSVVIRPFSYRQGSYHVFRSVEPAVHSFDDINNHRHVVANVVHRDYSTEALLVTPGGQKTLLAVPGAVDTQAYALNDADVVAGSHLHSPDQLGILTTSAYLWSASEGYTVFDVPGAARLTIAWGINEAKTTVGVYMDANEVFHGFIRTADGRYTTVDHPGSPYTQLMGINDAGDIVGFYQDPADFILKGFLYRAGEFVPISPPGAVQGAYPWHITDDGRIVGYYLDANGITVGFFAKPTGQR